VAFRRTVEDGLKRLRRRQPDVMRDFTAAIHEVRYSIPRTVDPPYTLSIIMLARVDGLTNRQLKAVQQVQTMIRDATDSKQVEIHDIAVTTEKEISLAVYRDTWPLFLEYYTYQGNEVVGSEPLEQT
jgi:hypothetical protein